MIEIRIGLVDAPRELSLELDESQDEFLKRLEEAFGTESGLMYLDDTKGKKVAIASSKVTYVEIEPGIEARSVGFAP